MAISWAVTGTNTTASASSLVPLKVGRASNYSYNDSYSNKTVANNITAPTDAPQVVERTFTKVSNWESSLLGRNVYPPKTKQAVAYGINCGFTQVGTDSADPQWKEIHPIEVEIKFKHYTHSAIDNSVMAFCLTEAVSQLMKVDPNDSTKMVFDFDSAMRGMIKPAND